MMRIERDLFDGALTLLIALSPLLLLVSFSSMCFDSIKIVENKRKIDAVSD